MNRSIRFALGLLFVAGSHAVPAQAVHEPTSSRQARLLRVAPDVSLEVIDWGGHGQPLVFLAGLGNSAHVFDEFAPRFTDNFHVLGITRRGFGASSGALPPNNLDTLVADIKNTLDSLHVGAVVLVGHSIAGEELTRFAETSPARCAGLVYLDAAYDRTPLAEIFKTHPPPAPPSMLRADSASLPAVRAYLQRTMGVRMPESEVHALARFDKGGRYIGDVTADSLTGRVIAAVRFPPYDRVNCRSLGIFAVADSAVDVVPFYAALDSAGRARADAIFEAFRPMGIISLARFKKFDAYRVVEFHRANHYVFLDRPDDAAVAIRAFLDRSK